MNHAERLHKEKLDEYMDMLGMMPAAVWKMKINNVMVAELVERGLSAAAAKSVDAGYSGAMHDGGSRALAQSVIWWARGLEQRMPDDKLFKGIVKQMVQENNPDEFAEYQRLHKIYGE